LLGLPVRFGQEHAGVLLDGALLDRPLKGANPARRAELEGFVKTYWAVHEPSAEQNVRRILRALVLTGEANLDTVAQRIGLHPRTLHRRLIDSGTSFRRILDDVRFGVAQQMLQTTNVSVTQLALWLGYSETAAFSHAFRRWAGISAADWRSKVQSGLSKLPHKASIQPFPGDVRIYQDRNTYPEHKRGEVQRATSQQ
jgi:AraC-like DNA-binding protein